MIVTAHIKFSLYTTFLDQMVQIEDERLPGESVEDGVIRVHKALEQAVQKIKDAHRIDLSGLPPEVFEYKGLNIERTTGMTLDRSNPLAIPVISKDAERLEIQIDNATTLSDLSEIKDKCFENGLSQQYIMKFNELNNAGSADFTAGLE